MTYSAPELLLVGAAQNLVLQHSVDVMLKGLECKVPPDEDISQDVIEYDEVSTW